LGLDLLVQRLRAHPDVSAVILFGSYARGEFGRKSDVDLLIVLDFDDADLPPESTAPGRAALTLGRGPVRGTGDRTRQDVRKPLPTLGGQLLEAFVCRARAASQCPPLRACPVTAA